MRCIFKYLHFNNILKVIIYKIKIKKKEKEKEKDLAENKFDELKKSIKH